MKRRIHYLQHVPFEGLGYIEQWALQKGYKVTSTRFYENGDLPEMDRFDWLIIMGGPMGVYDDEKYSWLPSEKRFIKKAMDANKIVLGICLGSQLIADVLGAKVYPANKMEIGWFPIQTSSASKDHIFHILPDNQVVFHWHGDTFDCPEGATRLAETHVCKNQAFIYNDRVLGLQFHLEVTETSVKEMIEHGKHELIKGDHVQTEKEILQNGHYYAANQKILNQLLDKLSNIQHLILSDF